MVEVHPVIAVVLLPPLPVVTVVPQAPLQTMEVQLVKAVVLLPPHPVVTVFLRIRHQMMEVQPAIPGVLPHPLPMVTVLLIHLLTKRMQPVILTAGKAAMIQVRMGLTERAEGNCYLTVVFLPVKSLKERG